MFTHTYHGIRILKEIKKFTNCWPQLIRIVLYAHLMEDRSTDYVDYYEFSFNLSAFIGNSATKVSTWQLDVFG